MRNLIPIDRLFRQHTKLIVLAALAASDPTTHGQRAHLLDMAQKIEEYLTRLGALTNPYPPNTHD
jgi:hypothetical protein